MPKDSPGGGAVLLDRRTPPHVLTLVAMTSVAALNMNMVLPSLPSLARHYAAAYPVVALTVSAYLALTAVLQLLIGPLSDRYGRRPVLLVSFAIFLVATLGSMVAPNFAVFLAFRLAQAAVASALVLSRAIVRDLVGPDRAASLIGYVTMGMSLAPMVGPMIGGFLDEHFGWQSVFLFTLVAGAGVTALMWADLGETNLAPSPSFGAQFRAYPELLRSRRFWGYSLAAALSSGAFFAYLGGAPFVGTEVYGLEPGKLGVYFGAPAVGYVLGNFLSGRFSTRVGINRMVLWGCWTCGGGLLMSLIIMLSGLGSAETFFGFMAFVGAGNGMTIPNATAGALSVRPRLAGTASGLSGAIMLGGGAGLSALAGAMLTPGTGALPLLGLMLSTALLGWVAIMVVIWRERQLGL